MTISDSPVRVLSSWLMLVEPVTSICWCAHHLHQTAVKLVRERFDCAQDEGCVGSPTVMMPRLPRSSWLSRDACRCQWLSNRV